MRALLYLEHLPACGTQRRFFGKISTITFWRFSQLCFRQIFILEFKTLCEIFHHLTISLGITNNSYIDNESFTKRFQEQPIVSCHVILTMCSLSNALKTATYLATCLHITKKKLFLCHNISTSQEACFSETERTVFETFF